MVVYFVLIIWGVCWCFMLNKQPSKKQVLAGVVAGWNLQTCCPTITNGQGA